jgi:hypothetical protein
LVTYLVAGVVGNEIGLFWTFGLLGAAKDPQLRCRKAALLGRDQVHGPWSGP